MIMFREDSQIDFAVGNNLLNVSLIPYCPYNQFKICLLAVMDERSIWVQASRPVSL